MALICILSILTAVSAKWSYQYHGIEWDSHCSFGEEQSPIDLTNDVSANQTQIIKDGDSSYKHLNLEYESRKLRPTFNANLNFLLYGDFGYANIVTESGEDLLYQAQKISVHYPSEHRFKESSNIYDNDDIREIEVQIEHRSTAGDITILAVIYKLGSSNDFIGSLIDSYDQITGAKIDMNSVISGDNNKI